jgi:hypothetical protein
MKEKSRILKQINSFKNRVIKGSKEKSLINKKSDINTIQYKIENNLIYSNNATYYEPRSNTTAPNTVNKKQKINNHLRITAKNKELENIYSSSIKLYKENINLEKKFSKKLLAKSLTKNNQKNIISNKKSNNNHHMKRMNSSNNIAIVDNNAIDFFTRKILEGTKNSDSFGSKSPIEQLKDSNSVQNDKMGLFNINLHSNNVDFDDINKNKLTKIKLSKHKEKITKSNKNISNNTTNITSNIATNIQKKNSEKNMSPSIEHNINVIYKTKPSSSEDIEANKVNQNNDKDNKDKESKKFNGLTSEEAKIKKIIKNNNRNHRIVEDEKNKEKNNKNITTKIKNEQSINNNKNIFQYLILKGNASYLVKYCMFHRINWIEAANQDQDIFNFKWKETSYGIDYNSLNKNIKMKQIVNHYEFHNVISNKANLFVNLMKYCEKRNLSIFKFVPFTIVFKLKDKKKIKNKEKQKRWNEKLEKLQGFIQAIEKNVKKYNDIGQYFNDEEYIKDKEKREEFEREKQLKKLIKKQLKEEEKDNKNKEKKIDDEKYIGKYEVYSDIFPRLKMSDKINKKNKLNEEKEIKFNKIIGSNTLIEIPDTHYKGKNMWVIKAINLNRGMCIKVVNSFEQMEKVINKFKSGVDYSNFTLEKIEEEQKVDKVGEEEPEKKENSEENKISSIENKANTQNMNNQEEPQTEKKENVKADENVKKNCNNEKNDEKENEKEEKLYNCTKIIIQKYIENPLLYKGRKCDMRIWVLLTHQMKVFLFKEGHLKTCSVEYDLNSKDAFTHITNYSFQKHNTNFQKFEKGNEVPFYEFQKFIDEKYPE